MEHERYYVKLAPGFTVTRSGTVIDPDGKECSRYKNGDGYLTVAVKDIDSRWVTVGVHRLVALAFIRNDKPEIRDQVNHFDLDKLNNHASNLDWVSNEENQMHYSLVRGTGRNDRLILEHKLTGESLLVGSLAEAASICCVPEKDIWNILLGHATLPLWRIIYRKYGSRVPEGHRKQRGGNQDRVAVDVKDLTDGSITAFETIREAADYLGVIHTAVRHAIITDETIRSIAKRYLVVKAGDKFPDVSLEEIGTHVPNMGKPVVAYDMENDAWIVFPSVTYFIAHSGLTKKVVRGRLSRNEINVVNGWAFTLVGNSSADGICRIKEHFKIQKAPSVQTPA